MPDIFLCPSYVIIFRNIADIAYLFQYFIIIDTQTAFCIPLSYLQLLPFQMTFKLQQLPFETSLVSTIIKLHFAQTIAEERKNSLKLNSNKTLKMNNSVAKIFEEYLRDEIENFEEFGLCKSGHDVRLLLLGFAQIIGFCTCKKY